MALATLSIDLVAKLASLEQGLQRATQIAESNAAQISNAFARTDAIASRLGTTLKQAFAGITITALVRSIVGGLDALVDLRDATGASIENLSALEDLGVRTGTSFDKMSAILIRFNKQLSDAKPNDDISRTFKAIGLSVDELRKLDPAEALRVTAVAFSKYADEGGKARAMQELFGKSIAAAGPFMTELASQTRLNATVTTEAAKQAERLANNVNSLQKNVVDLARQLAGPLDVALRGAISLFRSLDEWAQRGHKANDAAIEASRLGQIEATNRALQNVELTQERRLRLEQKLRDLEARSPARVAELALRESAGPRGGPGLEEKRPVVVVPPDPRDDKPKRIAEIDRYIERLRQQTVAELTAASSTREVDRLTLELATNPKLANASRKRIEEAFAAARALDELRDKTQAFVEISEETLARRADKAAFDADSFKTASVNIAEMTKNSEDFRAVIAATPTGQMNELLRLEQLVRNTIGESTERAEELKEALDAIYGIRPNVDIEPVTQSMIDMEEAARDAGARINDFLGDSLAAGLEGRFKDIGRSFARMLEGMALRALQTNLMNLIAGKDFASGQSSSFGGLIGMGINFLTGAVSGGGGGVGGGITPVEVGEFGELGYGATPSMAGPTFNIEIAAGVTRNELAALMPTMQQQLTTSVMQTMRRPGFSGA